eukprot:TRINITY_DN1833_c0_g1_i2.p1 TRINITY_DN1833_c0_g1~~TRINITY_DN1833_c0_g1_i2.p1  ORF type:complete len:457 (+),score=105.60 TRINITY_DN1833_c0_g1_i2:30-1373(+)
MEKYVRRKSSRSFGKDLIWECLEARDKDVVVRCSDGDINFHRFYLGLISPVLLDILTECPYTTMPQILVLMPNWTKGEVRRLKKLHQEETVSRCSLLDTLAILQHTSHHTTHQLTHLGQQQQQHPQQAQQHQVDITRSLKPLGPHSALEKRCTDYEDTIQNLSNIETLDLFDPLYNLDDIEIQNEDNLSLTIHSNDLDLMPPPAKKPKTKKSRTYKAKPSKRPKRSSDPGVVSDSLNSPGFSCAGCSERFDEKQQLELHRKECKKSIQSHSCDKCDEKFSKVIELKKHRAAHKNQAKSLVCQSCNKTFKKPLHLQNHLRIHSGEKPFICHTCGKCFNQESTLRVHLRIHSGVKPHVCTQCGESFIIRTSLVSHMQWKHQAGDRPFMCSFCSKSFPTKGAVRKHELIHKQDKKYSCNYCDKKYARPDHLKSHMRTHRNKAVLMLDVVS